MPIYEYRCNHCGHELEAIQKISEAPLTLCPACGSDGLKKKISAAVFRLKGKGWYETDFKSDRKRNVAGDDDSAKKEGATKEKENGKDRAQQQGKPDSGAEKSGKDRSPEKKAGGKPSGDSKPSTSGSTSTG